ncbi:MAG: hypothetical protein ACR2HH_01860 [Chthoniobacterales bacterium]
MRRKSANGPAVTPKRSYGKQRRKGPIYSLPKEALQELERRCASETPYRETADWLRTNFHFYINEQIVFHWWKRRRAALSAERRLTSRVISPTGGFKVRIDAPGAHHVEVEILPA